MKFFFFKIYLWNIKREVFFRSYQIAFSLLFG